MKKLYTFILKSVANNTLTVLTTTEPVVSEES